MACIFWGCSCIQFIILPVLVRQQAFARVERERERGRGNTKCVFTPGAGPSRVDVKSHTALAHARTLSWPYLDSGLLTCNPGRGEGHREVHTTCVRCSDVFASLCFNLCCLCLFLHLCLLACCVFGEPSNCVILGSELLQSVAFVAFVSEGFYSWTHACCLGFGLHVCRSVMMPVPGNLFWLGEALRFLFE